MLGGLAHDALLWPRWGRPWYTTAPARSVSGPAEEAPIGTGDVILYAGLLVAAVLDARTAKIPNWLTFSLVAVGLAVGMSPGGIGLGSALVGVVAAFALHFAIWQLGLEGAGDAKLMMAVGAFVGWQTMLEATLWRYVLLVPYALVAITVMGRWGHFKAALLWTFLKARGMKAGARPPATYLPFGPLIAAATPVAMNTDLLALL